MINGEFEKFEFIKKVLAYNLVAIIAYFSISKIVKTNSQLKVLIITLLSIILIDNIVTILQYNGDPIGWAIGYLFSDIDKSVQRISNHDSLLGLSITPGIFGDVVKNAFYIAVVMPLSFCLFRKSSGIITVLFSILVIISSVIAIIMTQERAAFAAIIITIAIALIITLKKHTITILAILLLVGILIYTTIDITDNVDLGRLTDSSDNIRGSLISQAIDFIIEHPILGGPVSFLKKAGLPAHNLIFDAYIYSGLFGFIIMMILFTKTTWRSCKNIIRGIKLDEDSYLIVFAAISVLSTMAYGMLHNTSFLSGEVIVFILLAIMLKVDKLRDIRNNSIY